MLVQEASKPFDPQSFLEGHMTPVFFGSAVNNFGVREMLNGLGHYAPPPRPQPSEQGEVQPTRPDVTGFVFKVQANMDPKHRDRVAFVRLASGHFERGMKLLHVRSKKPMAVSNPVLFLAADESRYITGTEIVVEHVFDGLRDRGHGLDAGEVAQGAVQAIQRAHALFDQAIGPVQRLAVVRRQQRIAQRLGQRRACRCLVALFARPDATVPRDRG